MKKQKHSLIISARSGLNPVVITGVSKSEQVMTMNDVENWPVNKSTSCQNLKIIPFISASLL